MIKTLPLCISQVVLLFFHRIRVSEESVTSCVRQIAHHAREDGFAGVLAGKVNTIHQRFLNRPLGKDKVIFMGDFFNLDNKFFQGLNKVIDCVGLSTLWVLCCIPIFTAGAATTALYYTINKVIRHGRGYVWKEYWGAFRINFKQSTIVWLILLLIAAILGIDGYIMLQFAKSGEKTGVLYIVFLVFLALETGWGIYIFPYIARFENKTKAVLKNTALIAVGNLFHTILLLVIFVLVWFVIYMLPFLAFVLPAIYLLIVNIIMEKIFRKYMSEEDIAAEEERNRDFYN